MGLPIQAVIDAAEADDNLGFCVACGEEASGVEPDAQRYKCEACGRRTVYGAQEILLQGLATVVVGDAPDEEEE